VKLVAFLGPSLPAREARRIAPGCLVLPPARQGDLWRALSLRPRAIALIDGVFESEPSVWHHEILAALACGVRVVGGASMGALRAAELDGHGMEGAGRIYGWYRRGHVRDDAEVAMLHASAEHGFRGLTLPLVEVRWAALRARERGRISAADERALVAAAGGLFYQERTWPKVLAAARSRLSQRGLATLSRLATSGFPSLKAEDARACLRLAAQPRPSGRPSSQPRRRPARPSSLVRRRRLHDAETRLAGAADPVGNDSVLSALGMRADASELLAQGLRRLLLAELVRSLAIEPSPTDIAAAEARWLRSLGVSPGRREAFFAASGLAADEARALCETLALEQLALDRAERLFPDGPSPEEALALEARLRGDWSAVARQLAARTRVSRRRPAAR
jgi:hypothetical protein